jgi:hypothetical protein
MPEGLTAAEVGKEIAEHKKQHQEHSDEGTEGHSRHDRLISIAEAVLLSAVALLAAWSGYSAAKWGTESSLSLARASATRTQANRFDIEATQVRTLDAVKFNSAFAAYATGNTKLFALAVNRFRPGYRAAFDAWVATHPLKNPNAAPDPSDLPQYKIAEQVHGQALDAKADEQFAEGQSASGTADKYVRLTVFLAAILFLIGISGHFPVRAARYGLIATACVLLVVSLAQLAALPGPPS